MKRKILSIILSLCMVATMLPALSLNASAAGIALTSGATITSGTTYTISNTEELGYLAAIVNGGQNCSGATFELTSNIVLNSGTIDANSTTATAWTPIGGNYMTVDVVPGSYTASTYYVWDGSTYNRESSESVYSDSQTYYILNKFSGIFDGCGHTVSGMYISSSSDYQGLFGYVNMGTIKNIGVVNSYVYGNKYVGGVAGYGSGTFTNCYNTGSVKGSGSSSVGGVAGSLSGTITGCYNTGSVSGINYTGGVAGNLGGTVTDCYNTGSVTITSQYVGGVSGGSSGTFTNCYNTGSITGSSQVGGVAGTNSSAALNKCYNTGNISGNYCVGGVVGQNYSTASITSCYNIGSVTGEDRVGGIEGKNWVIAEITRCYNTGNVIANDSSSQYVVGGVIGENSAGIITECYNAGSVTCDTSSNSGGIVGLLSSGSVETCFYDKQMRTFGGINGYDTDQAVGKLTREMTGALIFSDTTYWVTDTNLYPRLVGMDTTDAAYVSAEPVFLNSADTSVAVTTGIDFTLGGTSEGVVWASGNSSVISIVTNAPTVVAGGTAVLTATRGTVSRTVTLKVEGSATVTVNKDGNSWTLGAPTITLKSDSTSVVYANGVRVPSGTYSILANSTDTGSDITVGTSDTTATLNYYSVSYIKSNASFASEPTDLLGASDLTLSVSAGIGYILPASISVTMSGHGSMTLVASSAEADMAGKYYYNVTTGDIKIAKVNGAVSISVAGITPTYTLGLAITAGDWNSVAYGYSAKTVTYTVTNNGNTAVSGLSVTALTGTNASDFTLSTTGTATTLAAGATTTFTVTIPEGKTPAAYAANVKVTATENTTGTNLDISQTVTNASQSAPSVGTTDETVNGANDGTITGVNDTMEYKLSSAGSYTPVSSGVTTITGLLDGTYYVRYAAKTDYDASADATVVIAQGAANTYTLGLAITTGDWNSVVYGYSAKTVTYTVTNSGNTAVSGLSVAALTGTNASDFTLSTTGTATNLAAGATTTFTVTFLAGKAPATYAANVKVTATENTTGANLDISQAVTNASQSAPSVGKTDETVNGANDGTITGVNDTMEYKLAAAASYMPVGSGVTTITGLLDGTYYVRYAAKPGYDASADATVVIAQGAANTYTLGLAITTGDWNSVVYGYSAKTVTYTVTNSGNTAVSGLSVAALTGTNASDFTLSTTGTATNLAAGATTTFTVTFPEGKTPAAYAANVKVTATENTTGTNLDISQTVTNASQSAPIVGTTDNGGAPVIVNGETHTAGNADNTMENGKTVTTVTVDTSKLQSILAAKGQNTSVVIPVTTGSAVASGVLTGQMVKDMETKEATLEIRTNSATYTLPASEINIEAVSKQLGASVALSDIQVNVQIAEPSDTTVKVVKNAATSNSFSLMVPAVDFSISCTNSGKTVAVSSFNSYVERTVAIPDGVDPTKITTGIVVEADGTTRHVPTQVNIIDGKYYAKINSLTNSTYAVIWHPIEFADVTNHWAKDAINDMGSRMVITGVGSNDYEPDRDITRAEFAAIVVRALGLAPGTGESSFRDVATSDWYCGYIETASTYGIVKGYNATTFGPNDKITREQAMTMIARAMKITGLDVSLTDSTINTLMKGYTDLSDASDYAQTSIATGLQAGIITGRSSSTVEPREYITRAEVAVIVQRLLRKSDLI